MPSPAPPAPDPRRRPPVWLPAVGLFVCLALVAAGWWFAPELTPPEPSQQFQPPPTPVVGRPDPAAEERRRATAARDLSEPVPEETPAGRDAGLDGRLNRRAAGRLLFAEPDKLTVVGAKPTAYTAAGLTGNPRAVFDPRTAAVAPDGRRVAVHFYDRPPPVGPAFDPWPEPGLLVLDLGTGQADRPVVAAEPFRPLFMPVRDGGQHRFFPHWLGDTAFVVHAEYRPGAALPPGGAAGGRWALCRYDTARPGRLSEVAGLPAHFGCHAAAPGPLLVSSFDGPAGAPPRLYRLDVGGLHPAGPDDRRRFDEFAAAERATEDSNRWLDGSHCFAFGYTAGPHRVEHTLWPAEFQTRGEAGHIEVLRVNGRLVRRLPARRCVMVDGGTTFMDPRVSEVRWDADLGLYRWLEREPDGHRHDTFVMAPDGRFRRWCPGRYVGPVAVDRQP